jgi:hypothetical protein
VAGLFQFVALLPSPWSCCVRRSTRLLLTQPKRERLRLSRRQARESLSAVRATVGVNVLTWFDVVHQQRQLLNPSREC